MMNFRESMTLLYDTLNVLWLAVIYISEAILLSILPRSYTSKSIEGEVALVTGGAAGIGRLIAMKLAMLGAHVIIWDINESGLLQTVNEIRAAGGKCTGYVCDVAERKEVYKVAKTVQIEVGPVTLLVNNAGYVYGQTLMDLPDNEIERTFKVNTLSHYWIVKSFLKDMMKNNHGHIVTVASVAGLLGAYRCTDYSATKFAVVGFHESLFSELMMHGYDGIHGTLVCPYYTQTEMFSGAVPRLVPVLQPDYVAEEIVAGILTNQMLVTLPAIIKYLVPLKNLFPPKLCWAVMHNIFEAPQTMMMIKVRRELDENKSSIIGKGCNQRCTDQRDLTDAVPRAT